MKSSENNSNSDSDVLVRVEGVSKKFCLSLKKSLFYGLKDIGNELLGRRHGGHGGLRPKEFWAVKDVSFELKRGESVGLIGRNGAGKTTLLKMLNGLIKPDSGRIEMRGRVGALIALGAGFNPILTGRENIYVNASVLGLSKREIDAKMDEIIDFAEIGEFMDTPVQNYSSGMAVRLGFSVASSLSPDIMLLDEVLAVGDMNFQAKCLNRLGTLRAKGTAFIMVSHNMLNISRYCDRALYLNRGQILFDGKTDAVVTRYGNDMAIETSARLPDREQGVEGEIAGSGRIQIVSVDFINDEGKKCDTIRTGDSLRVAVGYVKGTDEDLDSFLELTVSDRSGILHQHRGDEQLRVCGKKGSRGTVFLDVAAMPFTYPTILFSVIFWNPDFTELYDWKRRIKLKVAPPENSTGSVHLSVKSTLHAD